MDINNNLNYNDYIFIIYSCKKQLSYANNIYNKLIKDNLVKCKIFIIYGDNLDTEYKIIHNYIILNVLDDYNSLNLKTLKLFETINILFPNIKGIFKCDDDIISNLNHLNNFITSDVINSIDYCGYKVNIENEIIYNNIILPKVQYCGGPLYYLSKKSLDCFKNINIIMHISEDVMVGLNLNSNLIFPYDYKLYDIKDINIISYHNNNRDINLFNNIDNNYIIIDITGGLANQIFQIGAALGYCEKYNKNLILSKNHIIKNTHQTYEKTIKVINTLFPYIKIVDNLFSKIFLNILNKTFF